MAGMMPPLGGKKKPMLAIGVEIGRPKGGPPPLDTPGKKLAPVAEESPAHEATESPEEEQGEDYGTKLLSDMTRPLTEAGLSDDEAKSLLADIFDAVSNCLRGEQSPVAEHDAGGMGMEGGEGYGR